MARNSYPLEVARTLRTQTRDARANDLADRRRHLELAVNERRAIERALALHREETERVAAEERILDTRGRSVTDMLRTQTFLERQRRIASELMRNLERARARERDAAQRENEALAAFTLATAEVKAIERHRSTWLASRDKELEKKDELEGEEHLREGR